MHEYYLTICIGEPPRIEDMNSTSYTNGVLSHTISMVTINSMHSKYHVWMYIIHFSIQSTPLCNTSGEVTLLDIDTGENTLLQGSNVTVEGNAISFKLPTNRHYNITVIVSNNAGPSISYTLLSESHVLHKTVADVHVLVLTPLGTHDIVNSQTSQTEEHAIIVTTRYSEHSTASGAMFSFVFITDSGDVDFNRSFLLALDRNTSHNHILPFDLYPGHYRVYVYDIEHDRTLHNGVGYPAVSEELVTILTNTGKSFQYEVYSL